MRISDWSSDVCSSDLIPDSPSLFMRGMAGARVPIAVAHGEGYADFSRQGNLEKVSGALHFVDNRGARTQQYPYNPNGSPQGLAGVTTADGQNGRAHV